MRIDPMANEKKEEPAAKFALSEEQLLAMGSIDSAANAARYAASPAALRAALNTLKKRADEILSELK